MKTLLALLLLLASNSLLRAEEVLIEGGRSPDGRHELRLVSDRHGQAYSFVVVEARSRRRLARLTKVGGFDSYQDAAGKARARWSASGRFVAVEDRDSRHGTTIYVLSVSGTAAARLIVEDYVQNALGRVGATQTDAVRHSHLERWEDERLHVIVDFRVAPSTDSAVRYECEAVLGCAPADPVARLLQVSHPEVVTRSEP